jgi:20S proteasome alpha/beta subunit
MTVDEAIELGKRAIMHATHRDAYSGGVNNGECCFIFSFRCGVDCVVCSLIRLFVCFCTIFQKITY